MLYNFSLSEPIALIGERITTIERRARQSLRGGGGGDGDRDVEANEDGERQTTLFRRVNVPPLPHPAMIVASIDAGPTPSTPTSPAGTPQRNLGTQGEGHDVGPHDVPGARCTRQLAQSAIRSRPASVRVASVSPVRQVFLETQTKMGRDYTCKCTPDPNLLDWNGWTNQTTVGTKRLA